MKDWKEKLAAIWSKGDMPDYADDVLIAISRLFEAEREEARKEENKRIVTIIEGMIRIGNDGTGKSGSTHNQKRKANNKILKELLVLLNSPQE